MDNLTDLPNSDGFFGEYGGKFVPETLMHALKELDETYAKLRITQHLLKRLIKIWSNLLEDPLHCISQKD